MLLAVPGTSSRASRRTGKGLPDAGRGHDAVPFGKGRIGWVAWHQIAMDESDFMQQSRVNRGASLDVEANPHFRTELCAPMVSNEGACSAYWTFRRFDPEARDAV